MDLDELQVIEDLEQGRQDDADGSDAGKDSPEVVTVGDMTPEELRELVEDALDHGAVTFADKVTTLMPVPDPSGVEVLSISDDQFSVFQSYVGSQTYVGVIGLGFLALLLGGLIGMIVLLRWKA